MQVLQLVASGKLHQDVIGFHGSHFAVVLLLRWHPQILAVVEDLRIGHVEGRVLGRLDSEEILRITQVEFQIGREFIQVLENAGKCPPINGQHGIIGIHDVEGHRAVVHVHDNLHGIADVVQSSAEAGSVGIRIGKAV